MGNITIVGLVIVAHMCGTFFYFSVRSALVERLTLKLCDLEERRKPAYYGPETMFYGSRNGPLLRILVLLRE